MNVLQGVPRLVLLLWLLFSQPKLNIMKYPFNHVISEVREFFEVFNIIVHAKMPKKIAECFFGRFQIFAIFLPSYDFCISLWASNGKISAHMINCDWILHYQKNILQFIVLKLVKIGQNWLAVFKHGQKLAKNWKSAKKAFCYLLWQLVPWCFIPWYKLPK